MNARCFLSIAGELFTEKERRWLTQQIRRLTVSVYERAVETAIGRGLFRAQRYKRPMDRTLRLICRRVR